MSDDTPKPQEPAETVGWISEAHPPYGAGNGGCAALIHPTSPRWVTAVGSELFEIVTSGSRGWAKYYSGTGARFIRVGNLDHGTITLDLSDMQCVQPPNGAEGERTRLRPGDILISITAELGMVGVVPDTLGDAYINQHIALARPRPGNDPRFIAWYLASEADGKRQVRNLRRGATKAGLGLEDIRRLRFPLAPFNEQKRIADKLDTLLAGVDACRQRLDRVPGIIKRFRQAVLSAAISGRLTEAWRDENGLAIGDWEHVAVGQVIDRVEAGLNVRCDERPPNEGERGLIKISAVTWGAYNDSESKTLPLNQFVSEEARIRSGDFLISRANTLELVGACVIVDEVTRPVFLSDKVLRLVMPDELKQWMLIGLRSASGRRQIERLASGNQLSMRNLSQKSLRSLVVPLPSEKEREEIVRRTESLLAYADRLEARYAAARAQVERLTPALLAKAFRGELVPQDPDDEPAAALLERIRAARAAAPVQRKRGRRGGGTAEGGRNPPPREDSSGPA